MRMKSTLTGTKTECLAMHSSSSHSQRQLIATQLAFRTVGSGSLSPASITGQTSFMSGVMNSLQPSTETPSANMAPRRLLGSGDEKYCWMSWRSAGKTWFGGRFVARQSIIRRAD